MTKDEILEQFRRYAPARRPIAIDCPIVEVSVPLRWLAIANAEFAGFTHELDISVNEIDRLSRIEDKYVNLCPVLNEQAGEIIDMHEQIAALQSREVCTVAHEDVDTCGYCQRDALTRENSSMAMKLAMIATGCYRGDVQEFAGSALEPPAYQGAVTDSEDVPRSKEPG